VDILCRARAASRNLPLSDSVNRDLRVGIFCEVDSDPGLLLK